MFWARPIVCLLLVVVAGVVPAADPPAPSHHVLVFGGSRDHLLPQTGHTWATFVRTATQQDGTLQLDPVTVSWMPATLHVRPFAVRSETGKNLTLDETIAWVSGPRSRASVWGPYEISAEVFAQAQARAEFLDSGRVRYRVFDRFDRLPNIEHCVHAVTRVDPRWERAANPVKWNSVHGTGHVVKALLRSGTAERPAKPADWLFPALDLDKTDFIRRE